MMMMMMIGEKFCDCDTTALYYTVWYTASFQDNLSTCYQNVKLALLTYGTVKHGPVMFT